MTFHQGGVSGVELELVAPEFPGPSLYPSSAEAGRDLPECAWCGHTILGESVTDPDAWRQLPTETVRYFCDTECRSQHSEANAT